MPNKAETKTHKKLSGVTKRASLSKTVPVEVTYVKVHPLYGKRYRVSKIILAHTEKEIAKGEVVVIEESRSKSRKKAWIVQEGK